VSEVSRTLCASTAHCRVQSAEPVRFFARCLRSSSPSGRVFAKNTTNMIPAGLPPLALVDLAIDRQAETNNGFVSVDSLPGRDSSACIRDNSDGNNWLLLQSI